MAHLGKGDDLMTEQMMIDELENQVVEWIRDYNFMLREIARLNRLLNTPQFSQKLTFTYGDDMVMPKGSGGISQAELRHMDIREKRLYKYEVIIDFLETASDYFDSEKEEIVYDCMIEGMSYSAIALHLGCSRDTVREVKNVIIGSIVNKVNQVNILQKLKSIKKAV